MQVKYKVRYPCSKNKSENIGYKFIVILISGIPPYVLYHWIEHNSAYFLRYCLSVHLKGNGAVINLTFRILSNLAGVEFDLYKSQISNTNYRSSRTLFNYSYLIVKVFLIKTTVLIAMEMLLVTDFSPQNIVQNCQK